MKYFLNLLLILLCYNLFGQSISGVIIDKYDNKPLEYASIGILNTSISTVSDKNGIYVLNYNKKYLDSLVRFSMQGYNDLVITIRKLQEKKDTIISLEPKTIELSEIKIKGNTKDYKVGITSRSAMSGFCGWGGNRIGKGHEIGLKIYLGKENVKLKKVHIRIHKQSFYSCLLRLHIRKLEKDMPSFDLLNHNILLPIKQSSGWVEFDLSSYDIILKGNIVATIEWVDVSDVDKTKLTRVNKSRNKTANVLISIKNKKGTLFMRRGSEAKWTLNKSQSPSIYLTVSK